ncbi:Uu.00g032350.m01.CDS01 [Anthostomella pinea]|uniref:Uu.00g032350.m01.CDS01 n=1 Tax=Anthostomella pinea TaxID=933095 RepID=A0AAI8V998_9PEZI|nr:Uu.00g032350.m01.CDS01 [Anthostomella pinea]
MPPGTMIPGMPLVGHGMLMQQPPETPQPGPKNFSCSTSEKRVARRSDLARHERTHSGHRPHVCDHESCGKQVRNELRNKAYYNLYPASTETAACVDLLTQAGAVAVIVGTTKLGYSRQQRSLPSVSTTKHRGTRVAMATRLLREAAAREKLINIRLRRVARGLIALLTVKMLFLGSLPITLLPGSLLFSEHLELSILTADDAKEGNTPAVNNQREPTIEQENKERKPIVEQEPIAAVHDALHHHTPANA